MLTCMSARNRSRSGLGVPRGDLWFSVDDNRSATVNARLSRLHGSVPAPAARALLCSVLATGGTVSGHLRFAMSIQQLLMPFRTGIRSCESVVYPCRERGHSRLHEQGERNRAPLAVPMTSLCCQEVSSLGSRPVTRPGWPPAPCWRRSRHRQPGHRSRRPDPSADHPGRRGLSAHCRPHR